MHHPASIDAYNITWKNSAITAGLESLVNYFQKGTLLGQKAALNFWYVDTRPNSQKPSYLAYKIPKKKLIFS